MDKAAFGWSFFLRSFVRSTANVRRFRVALQIFKQKFTRFRVNLAKNG